MECYEGLKKKEKGNEKKKISKVRSILTKTEKSQERSELQVGWR